ncbi:hypothetical protein HM1_1660 [Heliomicrobium modesticaldum Ice1]|uniref:Uncharacterized protein n=1 Tax=Heliobacterium modesticaldum (strain ATCC 51547 / Ice1) TaxID=498761 RepID=B0TE35_HELMI|nr:hypothetical protein HM1_1660 [Heliomicrobium modesticaldum Ice1]
MYIDCICYIMKQISRICDEHPLLSERAEKTGRDGLETAEETEEGSTWFG